MLAGPKKAGLISLVRPAAVAAVAAPFKIYFSLE